MSELTKIAGIGPTRATRLAGEAGIFTLADLAAAEAADVAELLNINLDAAQALITDAAQFVADESPNDEPSFGEDDLVSWMSLEDVLEETAVYENLLTGSKPVN